MSAERLQLADEDVAAPVHADTEPFALREQVAERLAAHRSRKTRTSQDSIAQPTAPPAHERTHNIAARVAQRYAQSQSYRAFLAEEAERAIRQAEAAAEVARRNADAVAAAQYNLLQELDQYAADSAPATADPPVEVPTRRRAEATKPAIDAPQLDLTQSQADTPAATPRYTVRLPEALRQPSHTALTTHTNPPPFDLFLPDADEALSLDEEIAFRHAPVFDPVEPTVEIPGNLIEFPRQLVAPRRARPRLAEGPLREDAAARHDPTQLRIFEVEAEQLSTTPAIEENDAPEWSSILLDAQPRGYEAPPASDATAYAPTPYAPEGYAPAAIAEPAHAPAPHAAQHLRRNRETRRLYATPLEVAPLELRIMSAIVDTTAVLAAFFIFAAVAVGMAASFSPGGLRLPLATAAASAAVAIALLGIGYQYFFFTFGESTPGMRYARIALCTFSNENPTREAMRTRILALALSSATLGLGLLWTFLDEDRLSWHDRISRIYQRAY